MKKSVLVLAFVVLTSILFTSCSKSSGTSIDTKTTNAQETTTIQTTTTTTTQQITAEDKVGKIVNSIFTATDNSFEIKIPKDWALINNTGIIMFQAPDYNTTGNNMNITIAPADSNTKNYQWNYFESLLSNMFKTPIHCQEFSHINIDKYPAIYMCYTANINNKDTTFYQYFISTSNHSYSITYTVSTSSAELANEFASSAKTFKEL